MSNQLGVNPGGAQLATQPTAGGGGGGGGVTSVTASSPIASTGGATPNITHNDSGVTAGSYTNASVTVNAKGHVTAASSGTAPVTSVTGTAPIASSGGATPAISLNDTAVTPGSYTNASLTVDQKGRLTAASSGTAPVTSVTGTAPVASSGGATPAISLNNSGTTAGRLGSRVLIDKASLASTSYTTPTWSAGLYQHIYVEVESTGTAFSYWKLQVNSDNGTNYNDWLTHNTNAALAADIAMGINGYARIGTHGNGNPNRQHLVFEFFPLTTGRRRFGYSRSIGEASDLQAQTYLSTGWCEWKNTATDVTSLTIFADNSQTGTVWVWGIPA